MTPTTLYKKFDEALYWNGTLFFVNKISKTLISFLLFRTLTPIEFSTWANVFSIVFILVLWADFGFSRSVPQYALEFAKNHQAKTTFMRNILIFKFFAALIINLLFILFSAKLATMLGLISHMMFFHIGCLIFFIESIKSLVRLLFHSYFWQKQFNFIESIIVTITTVILFIVLVSAPNGTYILKAVFIQQIVASMLVIIFASFLFSSLIADKDYQGTEKLNMKQLIADFIAQSGVIWSLITINSITERNFLIPLFTYTVGHRLAAIFKVANDAALFFQLFVIRTIGTTGTSLFSHLQSKQVTTHSPHRLLGDIFTLLTKRILWLTMPLLGLLFMLYLRTIVPYTPGIFSEPQLLFTSFLMLTSLYLVQLFFFAYDRLLEVKRHYKALFISMIAYLPIPLSFFFIAKLPIADHPSAILLIILVIHGLRSVGHVIRIIYTHMHYDLSFPLKFAALLCLTSLGSAFLISRFFSPIPLELLTSFFFKRIV